MIKQQLSLPPLDARRAGRVSAAVVVRVAVALGLLSLAVLPTLAADRPVLRAEVLAANDILTLADLVDGVSGPATLKPVFRAPALGGSGTIQARRIVEAAEELGLGSIETGGRTQVVVARAARRAGLAEIETALKQALEQKGVDARALSLVLDGAPPSLVASPDVKGAVVAEDLVYDRRSRRFGALVALGSGAERRASARITGTALELVEVAVLNRPLARGETVQAGDLALERRVRESVPSDAQMDGPALAGRVARRPLGAGSVVRAGDLAKPEIVARGDLVAVIYEAPGITLTMRGRAMEAGAQGDAIAVVNPQSKRTLQATVVAPGRVSVSTALPGRVAAADARP